MDQRDRRASGTVQRNQHRPGSWGHRLPRQQESALTAAFGAPVDVPISFATHVAAWAQIRWLPTLLGLAAGWGIGFPLRRHFSAHLGTAPVRLYWPALAAGGGLAVILPAANLLHMDVSLDLGTILAVLLMVAAAGATALSPPMAGTAAAVLVVTHVGSLQDNFGQSPFRGVRFSSDRLSYGAFLIFLGLGVLAASGRHWARWPGAAALLAGVGAVGSAVWPLAGRVSWWLIIPTTLVPMAPAAWPILTRSITSRSARTDHPGEPG